MHGELKKNPLRPWILILLAIVVLCAFLPSSAQNWHSLLSAGGLDTFSNAADEAPFSMQVLEVGKADSILLECGGEAMLVDGGTQDRGKDVSLYLHRRGLDTLKYVVNTHPDADHIGGLEEVLQSLSVENYLCPDVPPAFIPESKEYRAVQETLKQKDLKPIYPLEGAVFPLGGANVAVICSGIAGEGTNNGSLVLRVTYEETSFLLMGDAEWEEEEYILRGNKNLQADVLKVGHHGSETSTRKELLDAVKPQYAAISVGEDNSHLPRAPVLRRLEAAGIERLRTDVNGTLLFLSDGKKVTVLTERGG